MTKEEFRNTRKLINCFHINGDTVSIWKYAKDKGYIQIDSFNEKGNLVSTYKAGIKNKSFSNSEEVIDYLYSLYQKEVNNEA